jgi:hypothetical protein
LSCLCKALYHMMQSDTPTHYNCGSMTLFVKTKNFIPKRLKFNVWKFLKNGQRSPIMKCRIWQNNIIILQVYKTTWGKGAYPSYCQNELIQLKWKKVHRYCTVVDNVIPIDGLFLYDYR